MSIATVWVEVRLLGKLTFIEARGAGLVLNTAVEHGSFIITFTFVVPVYPFTVAVTIYE